MLPLFAVINPIFYFGWQVGLAVAYFLCLFFLFLRKGPISIDFRTLLLVAVSFCYFLIAAVTSPYVSLLQGGYQTFVLAVLPLVFTLITHEVADRERAIGFIFVIFLAYIQYFIFGSGERGELGGLYDSASIFGGQVSLLALIAFILYIRSKRISYFLPFIFLLGLLILSGHRTGLVALVVCIGYAVFSLPITKFKKLSLVFFLLSALLLASPYLIAQLFFDDTVSVDSINTSGRMTVWPFLFDEWLSGWATTIFGGGVGMAQHILITEFDGIRTNIVLPHNEFLRIGVDYGVVGLILCFGLVLRLIRRYSYDSRFIIVHFLIESSLSNALFWQISYLLPVFIFLRNSNSKLGENN